MLLLIFFMLVLPFVACGQAEYGQEQRYNDSLLVYKAYKTEIQTLREAKETDREAWYQREMWDDSVSVCARVRLRKYNKQTYEPSDEYDREGMGTAFAYPMPSVQHYAGQFVQAGPSFKYSVLDTQTRFITDKQGRTRIPYITRTYYDKGRPIKVEKLNPITFVPL